MVIFIQIVLQVLPEALHRDFVSRNNSNKKCETKLIKTSEKISHFYFLSLKNIERVI